MKKNKIIMKYYVYGLFEPKKKQLDNCFYIGKGVGNRMNWHFLECNLDPNRCYNSHKVNKILKLKENKKDPYPKKIISNISESKAFKLEREFIKEVGLNNLTNIISGGLSDEDYSKHPNSKINKKDVKEIKWLISNSKLNQKEIANKYNLSETQLSDIKNNKSWVSTKEKIKPNWFHKSEENKILEKRNQKVKQDNEIKEINWLLKNSKLYQKEIGKLYDIKRSTVSGIKNNRIHKKINQLQKPKWYSKEKEDKIIKLRNQDNKLSINVVKEIKWLLENTGWKHQKISNSYNIGRSTVSAIHRNQNWSHIQEKRKPNFIE